MNRYFSSFQKSRGGRSPPEKFEGGGGHVPPVPPGIAAYDAHSLAIGLKFTGRMRIKAPKNLVNDSHRESVSNFQSLYVNISIP